MGRAAGDGLKAYYKTKIEELELLVKDKTHNLRRLEAQRNELNTQGKSLLREPRGQRGAPTVQQHRVVDSAVSGFPALVR